MFYIISPMIKVIDTDMSVGKAAAQKEAIRFFKSRSNRAEGGAGRLKELLDKACAEIGSHGERRG